MIGQTEGAAGPVARIPLIPLFRLSARRWTNVATGAQQPVFETELVEYGDWELFEEVAEVASRHGDGIYEWASCCEDFGPHYVQVRRGCADWRRIDVALRKVVERDCGRKQPLRLGKLWMRRAEVKKKIISHLVTTLLPTEASYGVRVCGTVIGSQVPISASSVFFGLNLDAEACDGVGDCLGTIHVDGMIAISSERVGRFHRVECVELEQSAPRLAVRYVLVEKPPGFARKRIVACASDLEGIIRAEAQLEKPRNFEDADTDEGADTSADEDCLRSFLL